MGDSVAQVLVAVIERLSRTRRRDDIAKDLELLAQVRASADFGVGSTSHDQLVRRLSHDLAIYTEVKPRRRVDWASVTGSGIFLLLFAALAYVLERSVSSWAALAPGLLAALALLAMVAALVGQREEQVDEVTEGEAHTGEARSQLRAA